MGEYHDNLQIDLEDHASKIIATLPDFSRKFFNHLKTRGCSARTQLQYAYDLQRFFDFIQKSSGFRNINLKALKPGEILDKLEYEDLQEYLNQLDYYLYTDKFGKLHKKPASPSTKARRISSLKSFYRFYFRIGEISHNLADLMDLPKIPEKQIRYLDNLQVQRLIAAVENINGMTKRDIERHEKIKDRDLSILILILGTGIRVSELVSLEVDDFDWENNSILLIRKGGKQEFVYFGEETKTYIRKYLENCRNNLCSKAETAFFVSNRGRRISIRNVETLIKKYGRIAGINLQVTPHTLRRTYGTGLYESTGDIYLTATALGHSSVETTRKHYANMSQDHKRKAAKVADTMFDFETE